MSINSLAYEKLGTAQQPFRNIHYVSFAHVSLLKADAQLNTFSGPDFHLTHKAILEQCSSDSNFILYALLIRP